MNALKFYALTSLFYTVSFALDTIPVFVIDDGYLDGVVESQKNPFYKTEVEDFSSILETVARLGNTIVFFVEKEFSLEDITTRDHVGSPYPNLRTQFLAKKAKVLLRVQDPYNLIKRRFDSFDYNTFYLGSATSKLRIEDNYKHVYVYFDDSANETKTRVETLRKHDTIIKYVMSTLKQLVKGIVIGFYTGKRNPISVSGPDESYKKVTTVRPVPRTEPSKQSPSIVEINCYNATFQLFDAKLINGKPSQLSFIPGNCHIYTAGNYYTYDIQLNVEDDEDPEAPITLRFVFFDADPQNRKKGWQLKEITYGQEGEIAATQKFDIVNSWRRWYKSSQQLVMVPGKDTKKATKKLIVDYLTILLNKIKPVTPAPKLRFTTRRMYLGSPLGQDEEFRRATAAAQDKLNKRLFVTSGLLTGLTVTLICMLLLSWALTWMMSIHCNSRYDDADSKPVLSYSPEATDAM